MQLLSARWHVGFGTFTLGAKLKTDELEKAVKGSFEAKTTPSHPGQEMKISSPCALMDPYKEPTFHPMLDKDGNSWVAFGIRQISNTPNPAIVEAEFRRRAVDQFGEDWSSQKKKRINGLRKAVKNDVAETPFRLTECGAMFVNLESGEIIIVGNAGIAVAKDLVGRVDALTRVNFTATNPETGPQILAALRRQAESITPWPTGTSSLRRSRGKEKESCSVKFLNWGEGSQDAHDLLAIGWKPIKAELQWGEREGQKHTEKATVGLTGRIESLAWGVKISDADPTPGIEVRLGRLLEMDGEVRGLLQAGQNPLPISA